MSDGEAVEAVGADANPFDGDHITMYVRLRGGMIEDARSDVAGCAAATRAAELVAALARGRTDREAHGIQVGELLRALGSLPPENERCALTAIGALRAALVDAHARSL